MPFVPALLTPLILWKMPTDFLPILLGDYLTLHFLLVWRADGNGFMLLSAQAEPSLRTAAMPVSWKGIAIAAAAVAAYNIIAFGLADRRLRVLVPADICAAAADGRDCLWNAALFHRR